MAQDLESTFHSHIDPFFKVLDVPRDDLVGVTFLLGLIAWMGFLCSKRIMALRKKRHNRERSEIIMTQRVLTYFLVAVMTGIFMFGMFLPAASGLIWLKSQSMAIVVFLIYLLGSFFCT